MSNSGRGGGKEEKWRWEELPAEEYDHLLTMFSDAGDADRAKQRRLRALLPDEDEGPGEGS